MKFLPPLPKWRELLASVPAFVLYLFAMIAFAVAWAFALAAAAQAQTVVVGRAPLEDTILTRPRAQLAIPVTLDLAYARGVRVAAIQATTSYTASRLVFDSIAAVPPGWDAVANATTAGALKWAAYSGAGVVSSQVVVRAWFTVRPTLGGTRVAVTVQSLTNEFGDTLALSTVTTRRTLVRVQ